MTLILTVILKIMAASCHLYGEYHILFSRLISCKLRYDTWYFYVKTEQKEVEFGSISKSIFRHGNSKV